MPQRVSEAASKALLDLAIFDRDHLRVAMHGSSMEPLLRAGMVLDVVRRNRPPAVGEIVVFRVAGRLVAHRAVAIRNHELTCAGDAQPDCLERISPGDIVGIVERVWSDAAPGARRIDNRLFAWRGFLKAALRPLRVWRYRFDPRVRSATYARLFDALSAIIQNDAVALRRAIEAVPPWKLAAVARRHRVGAFLAANLDASASPYATALAQALQRERWASALTTRRLRTQVLEVNETLGKAGIECVLLKGAARLFRNDPGASLFDACDIDVLVDPGDVDAAAQALRATGYREYPRRDEPDFRVHHHVAPLYPPRDGVPIEIHRALAPPSEVDQSWSLVDLAPYTQAVCHEGVSACVLDRVGTAIHLAVHAIKRPALRDLTLLALHLRTCSPVERVRVDRELRRETREGVPLRAAVALATRLAGIDWHEAPAIDRFADWMIEREDLPRPLRAYPQCVDAWLGARGSHVAAVVAAAGRGARHHRTLRALARLCSAPLIACYLAFRRRVPVPGTSQ